MLLTGPGPEWVQTIAYGRAERLSGLTFSSCDSHKSNVTHFHRCVPLSVRRTYFAHKAPSCFNSGFIRNAKKFFVLILILANG